MDDDWIENVSKNVISKIVDIVNVWQIIGVADDKFIARSNSLRQHVYNLLDDMLNEEEQHKIELELNVKNLKEEIKSFCSELKITANIVNEHSLVKMENSLRLTKEELSLIKHNRVERYHELIDTEKEICERLFEFRSEIDINHVPSESELENLTNHINALYQKQNERKEKFIHKRKEIIGLFVLLDKPVPKDVSIEKIFADELAEEVPLSVDFLNRCDHLIHELLDELKKNEEECTKLRSRYAVLFNILYSSSETVVYSPYAVKDSKDFTCKTLDMLRSDVFLLEKCRLDKIGEFIKNYQYQIVEKMNSSCLSHFKEREPYHSLLNSSETSEKLLDELEHILDLITEVENQVSPIVNEVKNWNLCFAKLNELKLKLKDPVVLKNRGGILLKVEKEKNAIQKELPKSESRIANMLSNLKSDIIVSEDLLIDNMRILEYLFNQWNHLDGEKENDKKNVIKHDTSKTSTMRPAIVPKKAPLQKVNANVSEIIECPSVSAQKKIALTKINESIPKVIEAQSLKLSDSLKLTTNFLSVKSQPNKGEGFRIPKLTKIPQKKVIISPIEKFSKKPLTTLDRRISRSCSNLNEMKPIKKALLGSNRNLYRDFCKELERGIHTSSFIENVPIRRL